MQDSGICSVLSPTPISSSPLLPPRSPPPLPPSSVLCLLLLYDSIREPLGGKGSWVNDAASSFACVLSKGGRGTRLPISSQTLRQWRLRQRKKNDGRPRPVPITSAPTSKPRRGHRAPSPPNRPNLLAASGGKRGGGGRGRRKAEKEEIERGRERERAFRSFARRPVHALQGTHWKAEWYPVTCPLVCECCDDWYQTFSLIFF